MTAKRFIGKTTGSVASKRKVFSDLPSSGGPFWFHPFIIDSVSLFKSYSPIGWGCKVVGRGNNVKLPLSGHPTSRPCVSVSRDETFKVRGMWSLSASEPSPMGWGLAWTLRSPWPGSRHRQTGTPPVRVEREQEVQGDLRSQSSNARAMFYSNSGRPNSHRYMVTYQPV